MRFHILVNPIVPTANNKYNCDAFNVYAKRLAKMLSTKYKVFFYGTSQNPFVSADRIEYIQITDEKEYDNLNVNRGGYLTHCDVIAKTKQDALRTRYHTISKYFVDKNCQKGDFVLYCYEANPELQQNTDLIHVAPCSMGGMFKYATYTIFASSVWAHTLITKTNDIDYMTHLSLWGIAPPIFPKNEFTFSAEKDSDLILYLGRIQKCKGIETVIRLANLVPQKQFLVAGDTLPVPEGHLFIEDTNMTIQIPNNVKVLGYLDTENRKKILSKVSCLIQPSPYAEPFGFNIIEAYLSGTPVITTDFGTFTETVLEGITGFRCRTDQEFVQAIDKIKTINPLRCYQEGMCYIPSKQLKTYEKLFAMFQSDWQSTKG